MERQEIFDAVVDHLVKQGRRASTEDSCLYRTDDGLKCAVGFLISDEEYQEEMEGKAVTELAGLEMLPKRLLPEVHFLSELQSLHDFALDSDSAFLLSEALGRIERYYYVKVNDSYERLKKVYWPEAEEVK